MAKNWSEKEIAILRERRMQRVPVPLIAKELGRPIPATYARARKIGTQVIERRPWTENDVAQLKRMNADKDLIKVIARKLERTETAVRWKLDELGIGGKRLRHWTVKEQNRLRDMILDGGGEIEFSKKSGRPVEAVRAKAKELGLVVKKRVFWSAAAEEVLKAGIGDLEKVAEELAMDINSVRAKARRLGLLGRATDVRSMDAAIRSAVSDGGGLDALARRTGKSARALRARAENIGALLRERPSRRVEKSEAIAMTMEVNSGVGVTQVAQDHGRDVRTVNAAITSISAKQQSFGFRPFSKVADPLPDASDAIACFLAEKGVSRIERGRDEVLVLALRRRGYGVVGDANSGWVIDGRVRVVDGNDLNAFASARGIVG